MNEMMRKELFILRNLQSLRDEFMKQYRDEYGPAPGSAERQARLTLDRLWDSAVSILHETA